MNIIGITGRRDDGTSAGAGKDAVADVLVRDHGYARVALADAVKRVAQGLYGFMDAQLWGPSVLRNAPDERYAREHGPWVGSGCTGTCACCGQTQTPSTILAQCYLTPRFVLQTIGTECGRVIFEDTWVNLALQLARRLLPEWSTPPLLSEVSKLFADPHYRVNALVPGPRVRGVVVSDVRWPAGNEGTRIREAGGALWRVDRPGASGVGREHASERQEAPDDLFEVILHNDGSLEELAAQVRVAVESRGRR